MLNRRQLSAGLGAMGLIGLPHVSMALDKKVFRVVNPNGAIDATQCFSTCGADLRLGYYAIEGVQREQFTVASLSQGMVALAQGQADIGTVVPPVLIPALIKEPGLGIIGVYNLLPRATAKVIVREDSSIQSIAQLAGKRIGVRNLGDGADATIRLLFADTGLAPDNFQLVAIGDVGMAGTAIDRKSVDAMVTYDTVAGRIETLGFPIRYLSLTRSFAKGSASWYAIRKTMLKDERKHVVGVLRGTAKSTLFAYHNLDAAIQLHWQLFPESRPKSKSDQEAIRELKVVLGDRRNNWLRRPDDSEQRMGATSPDDWVAAMETTIKSTTKNSDALKKQRASDTYTNELIDEVNDFDKAGIVRQAKEFRI